MRKIKTLLIQNSIAPYRIPLFSLLGQDSDLDFKVLRLTEIEPHRKEWGIAQCLPFPVKTIRGFAYSRNYEEHVRINPGLLMELLREKPDVIIIGGFSFASLLSVIAKKIIGSRLILWFEGTEYTEKNISKFRGIIRKYIADKIDAFLVASHLSEIYIKSKFPNSNIKSFYIAYNNVDSNYIYHKIIKIKDRTKIYNNFKNKFGQKIILFIGQLINRKGVFELLDAFSKIEKSSLDASLLVLGTGPLKNQLYEYCYENKLNKVFFEGFVNQKKIPYYSAIADVFVLLSHWDCNPLVIFEALASGLPIVASYRIGNVPEFVKDNYNGYVVDPFDTNQVADRIMRILNDRALQERFSKNSLELSKKSTYEDSYRIFKRAILHVVQ